MQQQKMSLQMDKTQKRKLNVPQLIFWSVAVLFLLLNLGVAGLWGSEDRWAEISRHMLFSGDWLHPVINGEIYFDKPLLSYWLIAGIGYIFNCLNEFIIRLPSAAAALAALFGTYYLGRKLWTEQVGLVAAWLLLSCYGFIFWGRTAAADMENLAAVILAVAWFFARKDKPGFITYLVFYLICFLGAMTKGLPALVLPFVILFPYYIREKRWLKHLRVSNALALLIGLGVYFGIFYWASVAPLHEYYTFPGERLSGLELVWRENILRAFKSFDHNDEYFFYYLYHVPRILLPWAPLFVVALVAALSRFKKLDGNTRWLLEAMALIFLMFSVSQSRRWYYILPITPFCVILMALFLELDWQEQWKKFAMIFYKWVVLVACSICVLAVAIVPFQKELIGFSLPLMLTVGVPLCGALGLLVMVLGKRNQEQTALWTGLGRYCGIIMAVSLLVGGFFAVVWPGLDSFRTERAFAYEAKKQFGDMNPANIALFVKVPTKVIYYMDLKRPVKLCDDIDEIKAFLNTVKGPKLLISYNREKYITQLQECLPDSILDNPALQEEYALYEYKGKDKLQDCFLKSILDSRKFKKKHASRKDEGKKKLYAWLIP